MTLDLFFILVLVGAAVLYAALVPGHGRGWALLVGSGALAGALSQRLGAGRSRSLGMLGVRLLPMAESLLRMVRQLWSPL